MPLTPSQAFEYTRESLAQYLETQYRISNPLIFNERAELLRQPGAIAQLPFIESTPSFAAAHLLAELEDLYPEQVTQGLSALVSHGVTVNKFPLYVHQERALLGAYSESPNLLVATGTGSGKTESFLLPILSDILREAAHWTPPHSEPARGKWDGASSSWLHSRRHESRPAAMRGMVLYPMNALVNDQLTRLRRILSRGASPDWQRQQLNGNVIHFGMYTGLSRQSGNAGNSNARRRLSEYLVDLDEDWNSMPERLKATGNWPRPDSTEMLTRWDMQAAPPDLLVTNYSMLEYMLLRQIESPIFEATRTWLHTTPGARFTLVLDEAHTYTGAKGTEVSLLIRRLKERLGLESGDSRFRGVATTASVPTGEDAQLKTFAGHLFGEDDARFTLIQAAARPSGPDRRELRPDVMDAYARFHDSFSIDRPGPAIATLAEDLGLALPEVAEPEIKLHTMLGNDPYIEWTREQTARNATLLDKLASNLWQGQGDAELQQRALSGVLAAGSFARSDVQTDTPPLLSVRLHAFFRGVAGLWACSDPHCACCDQSEPRPVGKIYTDPRPWCECGARVLAVFTCRKCGLMFLGGIPDNHEGEEGDPGLWPWSDELNGERQTSKDFRIYGAEAPDAESERTYRSTRTTWRTDVGNEFARPAYEVEPTKDQDGNEVSPFPQQCPRCHNYRTPDGSREVIEPLDTKGPQAFAAIVEEGFRHQPRSSTEAPNYGRKAMVFSDSRKQAAKMAEDLKSNHYRSTFRQLLYRALHACQGCGGEGSVLHSEYMIGQEERFSEVPCPDCSGSGLGHAPRPLNYQAIVSKLSAMMGKRGIDPSQQNIADYFAASSAGDQSTLEEAGYYIDASLLKEIIGGEFGIEALGLGQWKVPLIKGNIELKPGQLDSAFERLTPAESEALLQAVIGILCSERIVTAPDVPKDRLPSNWGRDYSLVEPYQRNSINASARNIPITYTDRQGNQKATGSRAIGFSFTAYPLGSTRRSKIGRYMLSVAKKLVTLGRLQPGEEEAWLQKMQKPLFDTLKGFKVLTTAGNELPVRGSMSQQQFGIRLSRFVLHPAPAQVARCKSCSAVMAEAFLDVCVRCGQDTEQIAPDTLRNYFRSAALHGRPGGLIDDPAPLKASEHTAQVDAKEARDEERWFQDLFHDNQNKLDHRVDVLSVTTTMEMGIDIGSLLFVGLRNVPPTVANYQQRAGRAGRRGSALATVFTFTQLRSHDQYYYENPPEIVSRSPRVPTLHLDNEVIARRHVRSMVLQKFFHAYLQALGTGSNLFESWGTVANYVNRQVGLNMQQFVARHQAELIASVQRLVTPGLFTRIPEWLSALPDEINKVITGQEDSSQVYQLVIDSNLLPRYAFPVDVVTLSAGRTSYSAHANEEHTASSMNRDLKVGISDYAPGAEIPRQQDQKTIILKSAGLYDPFDTDPDFRPGGVISECGTCQAVGLYTVEQGAPLTCTVCGSVDLLVMDCYRPRGFTVDAADRRPPPRYRSSGGLESSGSSAPARLYTGESSFNSGRCVEGLGDRLFVHVKVGRLIVTNKGKNPDSPGYVICERCGRSLDPNSRLPHTYPADIPPHRGREQGPRAGSPCPCQPPYLNQIVLAHTFSSEVAFFGVQFPDQLDAPYDQPSGQAIWASFGTLIANAATRILQIDPGELKTGARAVRRTPERVQGEVFIYDDVPGGAGYARAIRRNLSAILALALEMGRKCSNPQCSGACYHCLFDYRNQYQHPSLDRNLGADLLDFVLHGTLPTLQPAQMQAAAQMLTQYVRSNWQVLPGQALGGQHYPLILQSSGTHERVALQVIHPLEARPSAVQRAQVLSQHGVRVAAHTLFDLQRRPFWVMKNLVKA